MVTGLTADDHKKVSAAIAAAEATTDGEILAVTAAHSDSHHDVGLHWAVATLILVLALVAWQPEWLSGGFATIFGGWRAEPTLGELLTFLMVLAVSAFTLVLLLLKWMPLRLALTPRSTKARRVRRRAVQMFKVAAERRTVGRTGILIYLSMGEHRAEIVADRAITDVTTPETWGEAMAVLLADVRDGRTSDGICAAIQRIGIVLAEHFPKSRHNPNEIPDKLVEL